MGRIIYLLDTNIVSETENVPANAQVVEMLGRYRGQMALASVSWHELLYGYHRLPESRRKERIGYFIEHTVRPYFPILPYDELAADWFARERARLVGMGRPPSYADGQIAAISAVHRLTLVTRNTADFAIFTGLSVENWFIE
jgi:tRNA(fMet)-specific endonuclease VapC